MGLVKGWALGSLANVSANAVALRPWTVAQYYAHK